MAKADWQFAIEKLVLDEGTNANAIWSGSFDSGSV